MAKAAQTTVSLRRRAKAARQPISVRERLLDAAATVMTARDTIDVSLSDIAHQANVNVALVSYYFGGKDELMLALAKRDATRALAALDRLLSLDLGAAEKLRLHLIGVINTFYKYPYLNRLLRALMRDSSTPVAKEIAEFFALPVADTIARLLAEGAKTGELRSVDPMLFYFAATGACENLFSGRSMLRHVYGIKHVDDDLCLRHAEFVADIVMQGCLSRAGRGKEERKNAKEI